MSSKLAPHGHECGCVAPSAVGGRAGSATGFWSAALPLVACALCPSCLPVITGLLSALGVSALESEAEHGAWLGAALGLTVVLAVVRSWRAKRSWPALTALAGAALAWLGHSLDVDVLEWTGVLTPLGAGLVDHFRYLLEPRLRAARRAEAP